MEQSRSHLERLTPLVMGGAGFSYQLHPRPESLPVLDILLRAFELGLRTIDTSPYYDPSEQLLGAALSAPGFIAKYQREEYVLMTKVGRVAENHFDYSPISVQNSVARSLERLQTAYLDVVFCHDVEFVSTEEAVQAVGTLFDIAKTGVIRSVGISGYKISKLVDVCALALERYGRSIDVVQNWAQLTLQNTRLEQGGFGELRNLGVKAVVCSSPLAVGLLRDGGIPVGRTGDWHPAPSELRAAVQRAAEWIHGQGESLAALAMRFALSRAQQNTLPGFTVTTATGISTMSELEANVQSARCILKKDSRSDTTSLTSEGGFTALNRLTSVNTVRLAEDRQLFEQVRAILGAWVDFDFSVQKRITAKSSITSNI